MTASHMKKQTSFGSEIEAAMQAGKVYDAKSDRAYARGDYTMGDHWARLAISAYTRAEKLSETEND